MDSDKRFLALGFQPPNGYRWLEKHGLIGFEAFTGLQPWYYLDSASVFVVSDIWPDGPTKARLVAFARRQDNDDVACFEIASGIAGAIVLIHGWTPGGYEIFGRYDGFWDWLHQVVNDMRDFVEANDG